MGNQLRVLSESFPMNINMTRCRWFQKYSCHCALDESSLSIRRVKAIHLSMLLSAQVIGFWEKWGKIGFASMREFGFTSFYKLLNTTEHYRLHTFSPIIMFFFLWQKENNLNISYYILSSTVHLRNNFNFRTQGVGRY